MAVSKVSSWRLFADEISSVELGEVGSEGSFEFTCVGGSLNVMGIMSCCPKVTKAVSKVADPFSCSLLSGGGLVSNMA